MTNKIRDLDIKLDIISKLLDTIEKYPNERIGQIVVNSLKADFEDTANVFYVNDRVLFESLNNRIKPLE